MKKRTAPRTVTRQARRVERVARKPAPARKTAATRRPSAAAATFGSPYEAADRRQGSSYFWLPKLEPTEQMRSLARRAIMERADWLYKNVGAIAMVIDGLALDEVGTGLWPKWTTGEEEYDREMTDAFHYANHDPRVFSSDGQQDYYSAQFAIRRMIRLYGDCFGQLLRPAPGSIFPQLHLIPGYLVDNDGTEPVDSGWRDGVLCNKMGRPIKYKVLTGEKSDKGEEIPADELLHFHDPFIAGQRRGVSALSAVVKSLFRREDIHQAMSNGTLARELVGYYLESSEEGGPRFTPPGSTTEEVTDEASGAKLTMHKLFGDLAKRGVQIPELEGGLKLQTLETQRPGTAVREFLDSILREVAWATLYPPEYVFYLAGMGQGTAVRLVKEKVKAVINSKRQFQLVPQYCNRWDVFWAWQAMLKNDRVTATVPPQWWKRKIVMPGDISLDLGREGKLFDSRVSENKMSIEAYHGLAGEDADDVENENLAVIARRLRKLASFNKANGTEFTYFDIWPRSVSSPGTDGNAAADLLDELRPGNSNNGSNDNGGNNGSNGKSQSRNGSAATLQRK